MDNYSMRNVKLIIFFVLLFAVISVLIKSQSDNTISQTPANTTPQQQATQYMQPPVNDIIEAGNSSEIENLENPSSNETFNSENNLQNEQTMVQEPQTVEEQQPQYITQTTTQDPNSNQYSEDDVNKDYYQKEDSSTTKEETTVKEEETPEKVFSFAMEEFQKRRYNSAADEFRRIISTTKNAEIKKQAKRYLGECYEKKGRLNEAYSIYEKNYMDSKDKQDLTILINVASQIGKTNTVKSYIKSYMLKHPDDTEFESYLK